MKLFVPFLICLLFSCQEEKEKPVDVKWNQEMSTQMHKELAEQEKIDIILYLERNKSWKMTTTGSGLQYYKYQEGQGMEARANLYAQVEFTISLLDGTDCYKTEENEIDEFKIDRSEVESGVQEAIKLMRIGDKMKLIIPSHLAHGLTGDMNKVPPLSPIVVDLHLVHLKP
jgi:FKBP-type peptidyl-prolyl cis-trans isomerase FkpA